MANLQDNPVFNRTDRFVEGWYWAIPSADLLRGEIEPLQLLGRELVVYRGDDGEVVAMDAHCPHMGAHLAEGRVEGTGVRCFFHDWRFERDGNCSAVPCMSRPPRAKVQTWPTSEYLGMVWVWAGRSKPGPLPYVPELLGLDCQTLIGEAFVKGCHPNVVLINAIDENHFNSVHNLPVDLHMATDAISESVLRFSNTTQVPRSNALTRAIGKLYAGPLTYSMCYHYASTGTVTLGPDMMHFHIMFALRPIEGGRTEGRTIVVTNRRPGAHGRLFNRAALQLSKVVGDYFAKGDTEVFETIRFDFKTPTKADHAIIDFMRHCNAQQAACWGSWNKPQDAALAQTCATESA